MTYDLDIQSYGHDPHTKNQVQRLVCSKDIVETNGRTDGRYRVLKFSANAVGHNLDDDDDDDDDDNNNYYYYEKTDGETVVFVRRVALQGEATRRREQELVKLRKDIELLTVQHESSEASLRKRHQEAINELNDQIEQLSKHRNKSVPFETPAECQTNVDYAVDGCRTEDDISN